MVKRTNKPASHTDYGNLIKQLPNQSAVLLTGITYIPANHTWCYLASVYNPVIRRVIAHQFYMEMTKELATKVIIQVVRKLVQPQIGESVY